MVAIPVRNEVDRIGACLEALATQRGPMPDHVVLLLNNCTDGTDDAVRALAPVLPFPVTCAERTYAAADAHAGSARREAMQLAARIAGPDGVLLTTDADGRASPNWLAANLAGLALGAEVVCGRAECDGIEALAIPAYLHEDDVAEVAYGTVLDRIHDLVDPDPNDPWPRHTEHSGASIAVTVRAWERAGGVPALPAGEDRGFLAALRRVDMPIRHAPEVVVTVSGRTEGRAPGGMAETIARRIIRQDPTLDDNLEPAEDCLRRAQARAELRGLFDRRRAGRQAAPRPDPAFPELACPDPASIQALARRVGLPPELIADWLDEPFFGAAWSRLEAESPLLVRRPVLRAALATHRAQADAIVARLLGQGSPDQVGEVARMVMQHADARSTASGRPTR